MSPPFGGIDIIVKAAILINMKSVVNERREYSRDHFSGDITFEMSESLSKGMKFTDQKVEGVGIDISEGGFSLITQNEIENDQIVRAKLSLPGLAVKAPTLVKVRWSKPCDDGFRVGVSFII